MITSFYVTFPDLEKAKEISRQLIEQQMVACANIVSPILSIYQWDGKMNEDQETLVFFKTSKERAKEAEQKIKELHPYECPCILKTEMGSDADYKNWIKQVTSKASV